MNELMRNGNNPFEMMSKMLSNMPFDRALDSNRGLMKADVLDNKHDYVVKVDLPGFSKDNLKLTYNDSILSISGQRETINDHADKEGNILSSERACGQVSRQFVLPDVDKAKISAKYNNGVLTVILPKQAVEEDPGHINID